jgi:shikimate kinase
MSRLESYILNEGINDKGIFKSIFMAGTPASGKSYVISKISGGVEPRIVNSDTWTEFLHVKAGQWDSYVDKVKILTKDQLSLYINSMLPLWVDGTSSSPPSIFRREGILKSLGYDTGMIWVTTDLETVLVRAREREEKIGRHVDEDFIRKVYNDIQKLKPYYKNHFDYFIEVHNNDGELTDEVLNKLFKSTTGFFNAPLDNPIGQTNRDKLVKENGKYLTDLPSYDMNNIKNITAGWFK